jgi:hypothetical protein
MLSSAQDDNVSLADVLPSCLSALGFSSKNGAISLPQTEAIVLVLVDGLGVYNIDRAKAYMRFIAGAQSASQPISTVFPSTTASALASLATGTQPSVHGILGYRIWDADRSEHVNQLSGVTANAVATGWLGAESLFTTLTTTPDRVCVIGHPRFAHSELTEMLYWDVTYIGSATIGDRFERASAALHAGKRGLFFVYISDLDEAAHSTGCYSSTWLARAEELDSHLKRFVSDVSDSATVILTADHGVIDVMPSEHINFGMGPEMAFVESIGGEPRCLQLKLTDVTKLAEVAVAWRDQYTDVADILTREDIDARFYGGSLKRAPRHISDRAGELYIVAKQGYVFYDGREPQSTNRSMIGQHGGPTDEEMNIPLLVWPQEAK